MSGTDEILRRLWRWRPAQEPKALLSLRVIEKSSYRPQETEPLFHRLCQIKEYDILLPQPLLVFVVALLIAFVAGLSLDIDGLIGPQLSVEQLGSYLFIEDTLNSGEFL